jgi:hypothetical protein
MPKIKNVSPFGDLEVPLLGVVVEHGKTVDVSDEQAEILLRQVDNFHPYGADARSIAEDVTNDADPA